MAKRGERRVPMLTVRVVFEPSRLAPACLADAYERVLPLRRRIICGDHLNRHPPRADGTRQTGGTAR